MARVVWKRNPEYKGRQAQASPDPAPPESSGEQAEDAPFSEEYLDSIRRLDSSLKTREQLIQRACELEALRVLGGDTEFDWLTRKENGKDVPWKRRILAELGRFEDTAEMEAVARELCMIQPTPEDAVALVNRFIVGDRRGAGSSRRGAGDSYVSTEYIDPKPAVASDSAADEEEPDGDDDPFSSSLNPEEETETAREDSAPRPSSSTPVATGLTAFGQNSQLTDPREEQLAREITDAMNRAIVDFGMRHDLNPQQVRRALMHSALEILRNCID